MSNPCLFIIAGPNGSGKSLFSKEIALTDLEVFDGDKYMTDLVKKFPETGSEALWSYINDTIFEEQKNTAIASRLNYAFETNFSAADPMKTARDFKKAGYDIHIIFMGLNSLEESLERVAYRVTKGGHNVTEESVRFNYEHGYKNLYKYVTEFDSVTLFDNGIVSSEEPIIPRQILSIKNGVLDLNMNDYPAWVQPVIQTFK